MSYLHDATPSWNGFNYQGKIALLVVLNKIFDLKTSALNANQYFLELEWFEDFAIKHNNDYLSIHQVKNYSETDLESYGSAIHSLLSKVMNFITPSELTSSITQKKINKDEKKAYAIRIFEYLKSIGLISKSHIITCSSDHLKTLTLPPVIRALFKNPETVIDRLKEILGHHMMIAANCSKLEYSYLHIAEKLEDDFSIENIKTLNSLNESGIISADNFDTLIKKVKLYDYGSGKVNCTNDDIQDLLDSKIKALLILIHDIKDIYNYKIQVDYISQVRRYLLGLIDNNVSDRHEAIRINNNNSIICINFNDFIDVLSNDLQRSEYFDLYTLKEIYTYALEEFITENLGQDEICQFLAIVSKHHLITYSGLKFIEFCKYISPHLQTSQITRLENSGLRNSFFEFFKICLKGKEITVKDIDAKMNVITTILELNFEGVKEQAIYKKIKLNSDRCTPSAFNIESYAGAIGVGKGGKYYDDIVSKETSAPKASFSSNPTDKFTNPENFKIVDIIDLSSRLS